VESVLNDMAPMVMRVESYELESAWRTMDTAPRDGTRVLWTKDGVYAAIRWPEYEACFEAGGWWMPLPEAPGEEILAEAEAGLLPTFVAIDPAKEPDANVVVVIKGSKLTPAW
jgi:hypothetical protein